MKITQPTTTSVVAVMIVSIGFCLLFSIAFFPTSIDAALKTQIVQGDWGLMILAAGYYFGASKSRNTTPDASNGTTTATMTGTITSTPTDGTATPDAGT